MENQVYNDKTQLLEAIRKDGNGLEYASEELKGDQEVVLEAVRRDANALKYASEELRGDQEVVLEAVRRNVNALEYASEKLRGNKEFVLEAIKQNRLAYASLKYASEELRGDKEVVLEAVKKNGDALEYASEKLRGDKEFVLEAVRQNAFALRCTSEELQGDKEVVLAAIKQNGYALMYASEELQEDKEVVLEAVKQNGMALEYAIGELGGDKEVVLEAVKQNGMALEYASEELRGDKEVVLEAVKQNRMALEYAIGDTEVILEALKLKGTVLEEIKREFYEAIKEKVGEKLTEDQIRGIVEQFDLEDGNIPQIITTTNPHEFEKSTRRKRNIFEHSWAGSRENTTETDVLIGDYEPGIDDTYEYSENGDTRTPEETHEMSDFSVNQVQVAVVTESHSDHFNQNNHEYSEMSVQIYLPEEREYSENVSFKQMVLEERSREFYKAIKEKVGEKLTDDQIRGIVEKFNLEYGNIPQIITTTNPHEFEKSTRRKKDIFEHSWAGGRKATTETDVLIGDYEPGIDDIYEYSENGDTRTPEETHEMSDFSVNQIQVAVVMESNTDHFNGNNIDEYSESVQIYLPEEREYPENVSFRQMILENGKSDLETRNEQLTALEEEERKISEAEALIEQQKDGQDIGE